MEAAKTNPLPNLLYCQNESSESGKISIFSETGSVKFYLLYSLTLLNIKNMLHKYHHSTKLYRKYHESFEYQFLKICYINYKYHHSTKLYHEFVAVCIVTSAQVLLGTILQKPLS